LEERKSQAIVNFEGDGELIEALEKILILLFGKHLTIEFDYVGE